jgi:hypothetical protein
MTERPQCKLCRSPGVPIAIESHWPGEILFWQCVGCENRWHFHTEGTAGYEVAAPYVQRGQERALEDVYRR